MKRIVFVDDEQAVLDGLRNRLRKKRGEWEMHFVNSGAEALAWMQAFTPDAVVSDMRMPGMDGAAVLQQARQLHPKAVRIILSGHSDQERMMRALSVAHQFLSKPCETNVLSQSLERIWALQERIHSEPVWNAIGSVQSLPPLPRLFAKVTELLGNPSVELTDVSSVISQDVSMTVRILRFVNSPYFGLPRTLTHVHEAVAFLGLDATRTLILSLEWFEIMKPARSVPGYSLEHLQSHSLLVGRLAAAMVDDDQQRSLALSIGMVHDIGSLAMACLMPDLLAEAMKVSSARQIPLHQAEMECLGFTHAEVGGYLLSFWGLPFSIVEAVVNHHQPSLSGTGFLHLTGAIHIAEQLEAELGNHCEPEGRTPVWDEAYVHGGGIAAHLDGWRELAKGVQKFESEPSPSLMRKS